MSRRVSDSVKYADISEKGIESIYWDEIAEYNLWENRSATSQMYIAGRVFGFEKTELLRVITKKQTELLSDFEKTGFFYWKDFFAERRARRPEIKPKTAKEKDVFENGKYSKYWDEVTRDLPWESNSAEASLYVIAKICGFAHSEILNLIKEQAGNRTKLDDNAGFFHWKEFLEEMREREVEPEKNNEEIDGLDIPYERYRQIVAYDIKRNRPDPELLLSNGEIDEEFLRDIHFNSTQAVAGVKITKDSVDSYIRGTLIGCIGAGREQVKLANRLIREDEAKK